LGWIALRAAVRWVSCCGGAFGKARVFAFTAVFIANLRVICIFAFIFAFIAIFIVIVIFVSSFIVICVRLTSLGIIFVD